MKKSIHVSQTSPDWRLGVIQGDKPKPEKKLLPEYVLASLRFTDELSCDAPGVTSANTKGDNSRLAI